MSLPGALFLNDLNVRNVSIGFICRRTGLSEFNLLMSMIGYGVVTSGFCLWNSRLLLSDSWSILSSGGSMKCSCHSVLSEFSISFWSVRMLPPGRPVSVISVRSLLVDLKITGFTPDQNLRGSSFRSLFNF